MTLCRSAYWKRPDRRNVNIRWRTTGSTHWNRHNWLGVNLIGVNLIGETGLARVVVQTPAMAAGVTPKLGEMSDMVKVLEVWEEIT